jgi:hypothetical protein
LPLAAAIRRYESLDAFDRFYLLKNPSDYEERPRFCEERLVLLPFFWIELIAFLQKQIKVLG